MERAEGETGLFCPFCRIPLIFSLTMTDPLHSVECPKCKNKWWQNNGVCKWKTVDKSRKYLVWVYTENIPLKKLAFIFR
jgi:hypothetical protein